MKFKLSRDPIARSECYIYHEIVSFHWILKDSVELFPFQFFPTSFINIVTKWNSNPRIHWFQSSNQEMAMIAHWKYTVTTKLFGRRSTRMRIGEKSKPRIKDENFPLAFRLKVIGNHYKWTHVRNSALIIPSQHAPHFFISSLQTISSERHFQYYFDALISDSSSKNVSSSFVYTFAS